MRLLTIPSAASGYVSGFAVPGFLFELRPSACLLATKSSQEMRCTGTP